GRHDSGSQKVKIPARISRLLSSSLQHPPLLFLNSFLTVNSSDHLCPPHRSTLLIRNQTATLSRPFPTTTTLQLLCTSFTLANQTAAFGRNAFLQPQRVRTGQGAQLDTARQALDFPFAV